MEHFDPERCLQLIEEHRVTHAQFVPTMFVRMLKLPEDVRARYDLSSPALRGARGGALRARGQASDDRLVGPDHPRVLLGHRGSGHDLDQLRRRPSTHPGSVGKAIWGEVHVCADDGEELPVGEDGVVYFGTHRRRHLRVQPRPGEDRADLQRQGLVHAVGRRAPRRGGLPVPDRPQALHDRLAAA